MNIVGSRKEMYQRAVGVFEHREDAERAIRELKDSGYDLNRVSLVAKNLEDVKGAREINQQSGNEAKEGAGIGATTGTVLGGFTGLLIGLGALAIPGVGPVLLAGAELSALATTAAGAGIGAAAGALVGALTGLGIPEDRAKVYEEHVKAGDYLVMASGTANEVLQAEKIFRKYHIKEFGIFSAPDLQG
jgi:uncharacterized membrane protein